MEPLLALQTATALFGLAALGGVLMAVLRFRGAPRPPSSIAMVHGLVAAAGLTLLLYFGATKGIPALAQVAAGVFLVAALLGLWLNIQYHSKLQPLPIPVMVLHAVVAVTGFALLLVAVLQPA
jgi:hypothetical protein